MPCHCSTYNHFLDVVAPKITSTPREMNEPLAKLVNYLLPTYGTCLQRAMFAAAAAADAAAAASAASLFALVLPRVFQDGPKGMRLAAQRLQHKSEGSQLGGVGGGGRSRQCRQTTSKM
ncbi:hypothetical protein GGS24DRAFT_500225 [Hypoxylon argillaceum]|nr:hypothetical protein GGS24DRAFT_500225 [Hypoxylon argillaceum]KAI1152256.1 hypothetical protein F4825DRAFT_450672 [Nemania diffusa]